MIKSALVGRDIGYTRSPEVHAAIARAMGITMSFDIVDVDYDGLENAVNGLLKSHDCFFVTKPYKNEVKRFLKKTHTECGVNFVTCGNAEGYNTDGVGFISALDYAFPDWSESVDAALVLGAGGAAYAVSEALIKRGKKAYVLNRTPVNAAKLCKALGAELYFNQPTRMIVNCTTLGLHGEDALYDMCVSPENFSYAFDLIYSPEGTPFLKRCKQAGAKTSNGKDMLIFQAIEGDMIASGIKADAKNIFDAVKEIL